MTRLRDRIAGFLRLVVLYFSPIGARTWNDIQTIIRGQFPDVPQIPPRQLAEWLAGAGPTNDLTIIDARGAEEYALSHLPHAIHAPSVTAVQQQVPRRNARIVTYCAVGYRSSALAEKLRRAGYTNVHNLEGAIFAWANEGRPLNRGEIELHPPRVHAFDSKWGQLLKPELRATSAGNPTE
jgi:rhodanese-related sulfurtransferase